MRLHELHDPAGKKKARKRIGRGIAAGQGKTGGYGTKGNGARSGRGGNIYFEGGQLPLVRRLPHNRGFKNRNRVEYSVINVGMLNAFEAGSVVDAPLLVAVGLIHNFALPIKVLGEGELDRALTVRVDGFSESARAKIEAAGGTAEVAEIS